MPDSSKGPQNKKATGFTTSAKITTPRYSPDFPYDIVYKDIKGATVRPDLEGIRLRDELVSRRAIKGDIKLDFLNTDTKKKKKKLNFVAETK